MKNNTPSTKTSNKKAAQKHTVNVLKKDDGTRKVKKVVQSFALAAVICGSESYCDFETFGKEQLPSLSDNLRRKMMREKMSESTVRYRR